MRATIETKTVEREAQRPKSLFNIFSQTPKITEYRVFASIELTQEEKAIIAKHNLWKVVLITRQFNVPKDWLDANPILRSQLGETVQVTIKSFIQGYDGNPWSEVFQTPVDAHNFEEELKTTVLPKLKKYIDDSRDAGSFKKTVLDL